MPQPGTPNNATGANSPVAFDEFTRRIPYGEKKVQGDLQRSVPLAGSGAASSAFNLPRAAGRRATRTTKQTVTTSVHPTAALPAAQEASPPPSPADVWRELAATPGAPPLVAEYAAKALS